MLPPQKYETITAEIKSRNVAGDGEIRVGEVKFNIGPIKGDAVGEDVKVTIINDDFGLCETKEARKSDYIDSLERMAPKGALEKAIEKRTIEGYSYEELFEKLPPDDDDDDISDVEFCDECSSYMKKRDGKWKCSSCGFEQDPSQRSKGNESDTSSGVEPRPNSEEEESIDVDGMAKEAKVSGDDLPEGTSPNTHATSEYNRSLKVKKAVKDRADGVCEGCGDPAPFTSKTGDPYLHAHHIDELSDGGSDKIDNVIALCPNCHYRVHHGEDGENYNQELFQILQNIEN